MNIIVVDCHVIRAKQVGYMIWVHRSRGGRWSVHGGGSVRLAPINGGGVIIMSYAARCIAVSNLLRFLQAGNDCYKS